MCNLYSITKGQKAIRDLAKAMRDLTGSLPPLPAVFPDKMAPVRANGSGRHSRIDHDALGLSVAAASQEQSPCNNRQKHE